MSGLAHAQHSGSVRSSKPRLAQPQEYQEGYSGVPSGSGGTGGDREHRVYEDEYVDDDDDDIDIDDKDSVAEAPLDRAFARLVDYIYERFPHSKPETAASIKPRCEYESYFSVSDLPEPSRKFMKLFPRVSEIQSSSSECAARLVRESLPLLKILPVRRRAFSIGDD